MPSGTAVLGQSGLVLSVEVLGLVMQLIRLPADRSVILRQIVAFLIIPRRDAYSDTGSRSILSADDELTKNIPLKRFTTSLSITVNTHSKYTTTASSLITDSLERQLLPIAINTSIPRITKTSYFFRFKAKVLRSPVLTTIRCGLLNLCAQSVCDSRHTIRTNK
jgi:hypothetical protein